MSFREWVFIFFLVFISGWILAQVTMIELPQDFLGYLTLFGVLFGVLIGWIKHVKELRLARKKDVILEYVKYVSQHRVAMLSGLDPSVDISQLSSNVLLAVKNVVGALDQVHVVVDASVSGELEKINTEISSIYLDIAIKVRDLRPVGHIYSSKNEENIREFFIAGGVVQDLNDLRYRIIDLVKSEIGDGTKSDKLRDSMSEANRIFTQRLARRSKDD